ncbi:hypothetical protein P4544_17745 [Halomonas sp. LY9]
MAISNLAKYLNYEPELESYLYSLVKYDETGEFHLYKARKNQTVSARS